MLRDPIARAYSQVLHVCSLRRSAAQQKTTYLDALECYRIFTTAVTVELNLTLTCLALADLHPTKASCETYDQFFQCMSHRVRDPASLPAAPGQRPNRQLGGTTLAAIGMRPLSRGLYYLQLCNYRRHHPNALSFVQISEDFYAKPSQAMVRISAFLGLLPANWSLADRAKFNVVADRPKRGYAIAQEQASLSDRRLPKVTHCMLQLFFEPWNDILRIALGRADLWRDSVRACG